MASIYNLIKSVLPTQNSLSVLTTIKPRLFFVASMQKNTLTAQTILFYKVNGSVVPATYRYDKINQVLEIQPTVALDTNTQYQVRILSGEQGPRTTLKETSSREYVFSFTTEVTAVVEPPPEEPTVPPTEPAPEEILLPPFLLLDSYPSNESLVALPEKLFFRFNEPVDTTTANAVSLGEKGLSKLFSFFSQEEIDLTLDSENTKDGYLVYTIATPLASGKQYEITIDSGLKALSGKVFSAEQTLTFQTLWEKFYSSVEAVRLLLGLFSEEYTDQQLAELIQQQSIGVYQLASMRDDFVEADWTNGAPYAASQYVLYRTAYSVMLSQTLETSSGMKKSFQLGDLSVSESSTVSSEISDLLALFEREMDKWWKALTGEEEVVAGDYRPTLSKRLGSATKAETDYSYPSFLTRASMNDLGG